jgi:hypothetical protein
MGRNKTKKDNVHQKQLEILSLFGSIDFDPKYDYKAERRKRREVLDPVDTSVSSLILKSMNKPLA